MPERDDQTTDLAALADKLKQLAPQPTHLSRDALLFAAGQAAAQPKMAPWVWPTLTGLFASLSIVLGGFLLTPTRGPTIQYVDRVVYLAPPEMPVQAPAPPPSLGPTVEVKHHEEDEEAALMAEQLRMRRQVMRWGVEMLPRSTPPRSRPSDMTAREWSQWLNVPPNTFAVHPSPPKPTKKDEDQD